MLLRKFSAVVLILYLKLLSYTLCDDGISIGFVIDDTLSMTNVIEKVKAHAISILDVALDEKYSEDEPDLILYTINDPVVEYRIKTPSKAVFLEHLNKIQVHNINNPTCPEMSMTGIHETLSMARSGSYIFVFTDALARDSYKLDLVKNLAQKKQTQVIVILIVGYCYTPDGYTTEYHELAKASSGQVMTININEMDGVLKSIKELLHGQKTVTKWVELEPSNEFQIVDFTIDERTDYVLIYSNSINILLNIQGYFTLKYVTWTSNTKVVKLINPRPGKYFAKVLGSSIITFVVHAITDFTFEHGFSTQEPKSLNNTSKQPSNKGIAQYLGIQIRDTVGSVIVSYVQLLSLDGREIDTKQLRKVGEDFYVTSPFKTPTFIYNIAVIGVLKSSKEKIKRVSKTPVEPPTPIPETKPTVFINEGQQQSVIFGEGVTLTCKVSAHPEPTVSWTDARGNVLSPQSLEGEAPYYMSILKLDNLKENDTYTCEASNSKGSSASRTSVIVNSPFQIFSIPKATVNCKYGDVVKIVCDIESNLPMKILWYKSGKQMNATDSVSIDGKQLTIKNMDIEKQGPYTCLAYLIGEPSNKIEYNTDIRIPGLARPVIESSNRAVDVMKHDTIKLTCKITGGYPRPVIQWYRNTGGVFKQIVPQNGEIYTVANADFSHSGQYKCEVQNGLATDSALFDVTVKGLPEIEVVEKQRNFSYGSTVQFTCKVKSHVLPTITWTDQHESVLKNKVTKSSDFIYESQIKQNMVKKSNVYTCEARNDVGVSKIEVDMNVSSPFVVGELPESFTDIPYGTKRIIRCDIRSSFPITIEWYRQNSDVKSIHSFDKLSISPNGTELIINSMDLDLNGKYFCKASLVADPTEKLVFQTNINATGLVFPEVVGKKVVDGKTFAALCSTKGVPKPVVTWQFKPKGSNQFHPISNTREELKITELSLNDSGNYECIVNNVLGEVTCDFELIVKAKPKITNIKNIYKSLKGDKVLRVPCEVTGFPDPSVVWSKTENVIEIRNKFNTVNNALYLKDLVIDDTLNYTCTATNELGKAEKTFAVYVTDGFNKNDLDFKGKVVMKFAISNKPVTIPCNIMNSDSLQVRWYKNGNDTLQRGPSFEITTATERDDGLYTCRVDSSEGSTSESVELHVGHPPTFVYESPSIIEWNGDNGNLDCNVYSQSDDEKQWFYNGVEIPMSTQTQEYEVKNWGEYKCIVSNVYGSVNRTFQIVSSDCFINEHMASQNMPLWFYDISSWPESSSTGITLKAHKNIVLVCPPNGKTPNGFQSFPNKDRITAECIKEDQFIVDGKTYKFIELQCRTQVEPSIVNTHKECSGNNTEIIQVGYEVDSFLEAYKVCYDKKGNVPLFGNTPMTISDSGKEQSLFKWRQRPIADIGKVSGSYSCHKNITDCCYKKSQIVNVGDVVFGPAQAATLTDTINSVAEWTPCGRDSIITWEKFEEHVRKSHLSASLALWTGASDYRIKNKGLVPRFLWKVIKYNEEFTVVVYINAPIDEQEKSDTRCSGSCALLDKAIIDFNPLSFYCCDLDEFSKAFGVPSHNFKSS